MVMKIRERITYIIIAGLLLIAGLNVAGCVVCAQETDMVLMELQETVQVRESDDEDAAVITELQKGTPVITVGEGKNGMVKIQYQSYTGYIPQTAVRIYGEENLEAIAQEQREEEAVNFRAMEEFEVTQKDKKGSLVLGGLIALIVIAIFGIGIVAALKQEKKKED